MCNFKLNLPYMQKERKDKQFIKQPFFEGGNVEFRKFVAKNMQYPKEALDQKIEGIVHLKIDIDHKGKVIGSKIVSGVGYGCDEEAMRIMSLAEYVITKNPRKMRVRFHKNVRIQFKLPKVKKVKKTEPPKLPKANSNKTTQFQYTITSKPKKKSEDQSNKPKPKNSSGYSYTIKF